MVHVVDLLGENKNRPFIACDFSPPRGVMYDDDYDPIHLTPDVFSVAYSPGKSVRVNPVVMAHWLQEKTKKPAIFTLATRDMNQVALGGLVLGAQLLGLDNMVSVAGDPFLGKEARELGNFGNFTASEFIKYAKLMNQRLDFRELRLNYPTNMCVGGAIDLHRNWDREIDVTNRKVSAGADFFLSQPVFDHAAPREFLDSYEDRVGYRMPVPVMWGIQMLTRNSSSLVPIPESIERDLEKGAAPVDIVVDMIDNHQRNGFNAFYLIPPILEGGRRDYELAQAVIEKL